MMSTAVLDQRAVLDTYDRDGYVIFRDLLDAELIAEASDHVTWLSNKYPDVRPEQLGHQFVARDPFWVRLVSDERLLDVAQVFVGPDIALFASHYISKPPFSGQPVLWHQDAAYWPLEPMNVVTMWLAIDHSTPENGCLQVIPGSHKSSIQGLRENTTVESVLGSEVDVDVDESQAVDLILRPGDAEVHHPNILHGSKANTSPHRRCGLTIRYIPTSTRILGDEQPFASALLVRGEPGVNAYQPHPTYDPQQHFPFRDARR
jgi:ectoine hydroxylase-related dioxygenase (phytanoyl-CoA dioxygenase family)